MGSSFDDALRSGRARRGFATTAIVVVGLVLVLTPAPAVAAAQPAGTDRATAGSVALEGVYRAVVATPSAEHDDAQPRTEHWLELPEGEQIPLDLPLSAALVPGQHVRVHGAAAARGAALQVESVASIAPEPSITATAGGTVSLLVMLVHWTEPDDQTPEVVRQQVAETQPGIERCPTGPSTSRAP